MKETIYTIPINEAFEEECGCPFCSIEKRLENEAVEYALGPAMMEPDYRELSNERGYCNKHFEMLFRSQNKLPLALVLDTHLEELRKKLKKMKPSKKSLFKKSSAKPSMKTEISSCIVCEKIEKNMDRYFKVMLDMWKTDSDFREKFEKSDGFCLPHFEKLYALSDNTEFLNSLVEKEERALDALQEDIHRFTLKFDYRNKDMEWGNAKDAPIRAVSKIAGYIRANDDEI